MSKPKNVSRLMPRQRLGRAAGASIRTSAPEAIGEKILELALHISLARA